MTAAQFLSVLQRDKLVSPQVLASLRHQVENAHEPISPIALAKLLVSKGKLHWLKAQQLLPQGDFKPAIDSDEVRRAAEKALIVKSSTESLEAQFGLSPTTADAPKKLQPAKARPTTQPHSQASRQPSSPPANSSKPQLPQSKPAAQKREQTSTATLDLDEELAAGGGSSVLGGLEELLDDSGFSSASGLGASALSSTSVLGKDKAAGVHSSLSRSALGSSLRTAKPLGSANTGGRARAGKWLWIGGVTLAVLLVGGVLLGAHLLRGSGDEELQAAQAEFEKQAYQPAIEKYGEFLASFPHHRRAADARVHRAVAQIRLANSIPPNWPALLPIARTQLSEVCTLAEYGPFSAEMTQLLARLTEGLCVRVEISDTLPGSLFDPVVAMAEARDSLALLGDDRIVPADQRPWQRIEAWSDRLQLAEYRARQMAAAEQATNSIRAAIEAKKPAAAYEASALLRASYPQAAVEPALANLLRDVAGLELARAKTTHDKLSATIIESKSALLGSLTPAATSGKPVAALRGQRYFATDGEAVYAFDAANGKLLWRRYVGLDAQWLVMPGGNTSRVLLYAPGQKELTCVDAASSKLVWRLELPAPIVGNLVSVGGRVFASTESNHVISLDPTTGESAAQVQLPLRLCGHLTASENGVWLYVLAEHGILFSISANDLSAQAAIATGVQPHFTHSLMLAGRGLVLIENGTENQTRLVPIALDKRETANAVLEALPLARAISSTPIIVATKLLLPTVSGEILGFESTSSDRIPLKPATKFAIPAGQATTASSPSDLRSMTLFSAERSLYTAGQGLSRYSLGTSNKPTLTWTSLPNHTCQSAQAFGEHLIVTHRALESAGLCVTCVSATTGAPTWSTEIAAPLLDVTIDHDAKRMTLVNAAGNVHTALAGGSAVAQTIKATSESRPASTFAVRSEPTGWLLGATCSKQIESFGGDGKRLIWSLPSGVACTPQLFGPGLLMPLLSGELLVVDPKDGNPLAAPLIPRAQPGVKMNWQIIDVDNRSAAEPSAVVYDGAGHCYRISLVSDPALRMRLDAQLEIDLAQPVRAATLAQTEAAPLLLIDRQHNAWSCDRQTLKLGKSWSLSAGEVSWGPCTVGDTALLATDQDELYAFSTTGQRWTTRLAGGPLVGKPLATKDAVVIATASGHVLRLDPNTGKVLAEIDVGQSLSLGPFANGDGLVVGSRDGSLLQVPVP